MQRVKNLLLAASLLFAIGAMMPATVIAEAPLNAVCRGDTLGSPVCSDKNKTGNPIIGPGGIVTKVTQILIFIIGITSVIVIIISGLRYILSNGDANTVNVAKNSIIYALVGIVVAILAQSIVTFVLNKL